MISEGKGTWYFNNGDVYEGEMKNRLFHGTGTLKEKGGYQYTGGWQFGMKHGSAEETLENGTIRKSNWKKDKIVQ